MARPVGFWLNLFELAKQLGNVQKACTRMKVSRDSYYRMRKRRRGKGGLEPRPRRGAARVSPKIEKGVLDFTYSAPELGKGSIAALVCSSGLEVSATGVRGVWLRHKPPLVTRKARFELARGMGMTMATWRARLAAANDQARAAEKATIESTRRAKSIERWGDAGPGPVTITDASGKVTRVLRPRM